MRYSRQEMIDLLLKKYCASERIQILAPIKLQKEDPEEVIGRLQNMGFIRLRLDGVEWTGELPPTSRSKAFTY